MKASERDYDLIMKALQINSIRTAQIEKSFSLKPGTIHRWKTYDFSVPGLILLKIVHAYPWILEVAAHKFEEEVKDKKVIEQVYKMLGNIVNEK